MRRRELITLLGGTAATWPLGVRAQQPPKVARIGYLGLTSPTNHAARVEALRAGLRDLGYVEGKNILIEFRWAEGKYDRLPALAAELVHLNVDDPTNAKPLPSDWYLELGDRASRTLRGETPLTTAVPAPP